MNHNINAKLWIGTEQEYEDEGHTKMFVDGASVEEIEAALDAYPDVGELYFAHGVSPVVLKYFENKIKITVEVTSHEDVPTEMRGRINVILRLPTWVDKTKVRGENGGLTVSDPREGEYTEWTGQKVYDEDSVVLWKEADDD